MNESLDHPEHLLPSLAYGSAASFQIVFEGVIFRKSTQYFL